MAKRNVNASPPEPAVGNQPDPGFLECLFHHLVLEQDERGACRASRRNAGIPGLVQLIQTFGDARCHAPLEAERGTTESGPLEPLTMRTKGHELGPDRAIDDFQEIGAKDVSASKPKNT